MTRKTAPPGRAWMNLTLPGIGLTLALAALIAAVVMWLSGCGMPLDPFPQPQTPVTTITFLATGVPDANGKVKTTGIIVVIDMTFAPGVAPEGTIYPHEWVDVVPFSHHQIAQQGTVSSYLMTVHPTEPGQSVTCAILFNGNAAKPVDTHTATYPAPAVCSGPPV